MKDLGTFHYFLGIGAAYSPRGYLLSQSMYIANIIEQARISNTRTTNSPLQLNVNDAPSDGAHILDPTLYRTLIGNLVYLIITRPNISYVVHLVF